MAIHAADLWQGGSSPLPDLDGSGVPAIGIWDLGAVRTDHVEFGLRVSLGESDIRQELDIGIGDKISADHPTGVAGTLASSGMTFPERRGMASGVTLKSYHLLHDFSEMGEAAKAGMLFSNHSYGTCAEWQGEVTWRGPHDLAGEDPEFGSYTTSSRTVDALAYLAPHYLSVWASGNEVTDDGASQNGLIVYVDSDGDGKFDEFSDPETTHPQESGTPLLGATKIPNEEGGEPLNIPGPGFDTIVSTGSAKNTTLNPAGTNTVIPLTGPDPFFGWGAPNAVAAAELLTRNFFGGSRTAHLCEHLLVNGSTIEIPLCHDGVSPEMKVMICWTDPPYQTSLIGGLGDDVTDPETGPADEDRPINRQRLMNDVDLRVISPDGQITYEPWKLEPEDPMTPLANPLNRASPGDNSLDNIEQVIVPAPVAGNYTLRISHKGSLKALQLLTTPVPGTVLPDGAQFQLLSSGQSQAVSICMIGNKDPSPLLPQLSEPLIINGNLYLELRGHFGVHYELEKSFDMISWSVIPGLTFEVNSFPLPIGPIWQAPVAPKAFYRVKSLPASQ